MCVGDTPSNSAPRIINMNSAMSNPRTTCNLLYERDNLHMRFCVSNFTVTTTTATDDAGVWYPEFIDT